MIVAVVAAGASFSMKASARSDRASFIAEDGTTRGAPSTTFAELLPEAPVAFVSGLGVVGAIGIAVFLGVAATFRQSRAARSEATHHDRLTPPPARAP